jgi:hypothetical protein
MFRFEADLKVFLHRDPVDFRYGMNSLSILGCHQDTDFFVRQDRTLVVQAATPNRMSLRASGCEKKGKWLVANV